LPYPDLLRFIEKVTLDNPFIELDYALDPTTVNPSSCRPDELISSPDPMDTLALSLRLQLITHGCRPDVLEAGLCVIDFIDDRGYCPYGADEIARRGGLRQETVSEALELIKTFEPRGVGAYDLRECLLLQADESHPDYDAIRRLLNVPEELILSGNTKRLCGLCETDPDSLRAILRYLSGLSPFPGGAFPQSAPPGYVFPEIEVNMVDGGVELVIHGGDGFVSVGADYYHSALEAAAGDLCACEFIRSKYSEATALVHQLSLRRKALESLMLYLLDVQREYLTVGGRPPNPVTMREAAIAIGMHPSTVTRCVNGKYIQTKRGAIPLRSLFSSPLPANAQARGADGGADGGTGTGTGTGKGMGVSQAAAKDAIRSLIGEESPGSPVTDQAIADHLLARGISISRRTVAKYRGQMGIGGAASRALLPRRPGCPGSHPNAQKGVNT
jgi:RNA polymerase sigma-54 factor